jgi:hypothetical protein
MIRNLREVINKQIKYCQVLRKRHIHLPCPTPDIVDWLIS